MKNILRSLFIFTTIFILGSQSLEAATLYRGETFALRSSLDYQNIFTNLNEIPSTLSDKNARLVILRIRAVVRNIRISVKSKELLLARHYSNLSNRVYAYSGSEAGENIRKLTILKELLFTGNSGAVSVTSSGEVVSEKPVTQTGIIDTLTSTASLLPKEIYSTGKVLENLPPVPLDSSTKVVSICRFGCTYSISGTTLNRVIRNILDTKSDNNQLTITVGADTYVLDGGISITKDNIILRGEGKSNTRIIGKAGVDVVSWSAGNGVLENFTIDATNALTAFSSGRGNMTIRNSIFLGGVGSFVVFFGGQEHDDGVAYINPKSAYQLYRNNRLNSEIIVENSEIYSQYSGDTLVVALTQGAIVRNNIIQGKLSYYMSKNGSIYGNTFQNTPSDALFISGPSSSVTISGNQFTNIGGSAIVIRNQGEHPLPSETISDNIQILNNAISQTTYFGINATQFSKSTISNNTIRNIGAAGVYILGDSYGATRNITVSENTIENPRTTSDPQYTRVWGAGIGIENTDSVSITSNIISDNRAPVKMYYGIYSHDNNTGLVLTTNKITGATISSYY